MISKCKFDFSPKSLLNNDIRLNSQTIKFLNESLTESGSNLSDIIRITDNNAFVNTTAKSGFNTTANITFS